MAWSRRNSGAKTHVERMSGERKGYQLCGARGRTSNGRVIHDVGLHAVPEEVFRTMWADKKCKNCAKLINDNNELSPQLPPPRKVFLKVSFYQKNDAKREGAWWDNDQKSWYVMSHFRQADYLIDKYGER